MLKTLFSLAACAVPALAGSSDDTIANDLAAMQCQAVTTPSGSVFSLSGLEAPGGGYSYRLPSHDLLLWNYCTYLENTDYQYAYMRGLNVCVAN